MSWESREIDRDLTAQGNKVESLCRLSLVVEQNLQPKPLSETPSAYHHQPQRYFHSV